MFSRTHELTNKLISKAPRSNRQATKRTPSLSVNRRKRTKQKPGEKSQFDFLSNDLFGSLISMKNSLRSLLSPPE
ncbi:hypothetical protein GQ457_05G020180 [Hibiscus cannabinus]